MTIAVEFAVSLATLLVEYKNLVALYEGRNNLTYYLCALYCRSADGDGTVVVDEENLVELNSLSSLSGLDMVYEELLALLNLKLLTVNLYDCVHLILKKICIKRFFPGGGISHSAA